MKRVWLAFALALALVRPASAQLAGASLVIDPTAISKAVAQLQQDYLLVQSAQTQLMRLPATFQGTNIQGRLSAVSGLLQQAQATCMQVGRQAAPGRPQVTPAQCQVLSTTATTQASQLGGSMSTLTSLQNVAAGSVGGLQAQQATAHGLIEVATQLQQIHQLDIATGTQTAINGQQQNNTVHGKSQGGGP